MAGILDFIGSQGGGGLLDFLRNNALNQQFSSGLPSDQAQYGQPQQYGQPSPLDNAQWPYGPNGAPSQGNAQMIQPQQQAAPRQQPMQAPQQAPQQALQPAYQPQDNSGGFGAGLAGFLSNLQAGPIGALAGGLGAGLGLQDPQTRAEQQNKNLTKQWLLSRGVDPVTINAAMAQPDLLKTLIEQMKPKTPMNLGQGYIYEPDSKKTTRVYEPDDKTPNSALEYNFYKQNLPKGETPVTYQKWLATKDTDPNKISVLGREGELWKPGPDGTPIILHKNESNPEPMDPNSLDVLARREIGGDFGGRKNLGRGAQGAADLKAITNKSTDILINEMGMTPAQAAAHISKKQQEYNAQGQGLNSEARTTGVREANLNLILKAADAAIPAALEASDKVARTGWVPLNKIIQGGEVATSNPELKKFGMANLQLAEHWARAMNPTGVMRESDRDKALSYLSTADSKETYKEAVGQLRTQIERERDAVRSTRGMTALPGAAPETTPQPGTTGLPSGWSVKVR